MLSGGSGAGGRAAAARGARPLRAGGAPVAGPATELESRAVTIARDVVWACAVLDDLPHGGLRFCIAFGRRRRRPRA